MRLFEQETVTARPSIKLLMFNRNVYELNLFNNFQRAFIFANLVNKFIGAHAVRGRNLKEGVKDSI